MPRAFAILNGTAMTALGLGADRILIVVPLGLGLDATAVVLTKRDPLWLDVLPCGIRHPAG